MTPKERLLIALKSEKADAGGEVVTNTIKASQGDLRSLMVAENIS